MSLRSIFLALVAINISGCLISALSPPYCPNVETCGEGTSWDIFKCECVTPENKFKPPCMILAKCAAGYTFDREVCDCVKIPCGTVQCPENYKPDPKDKCKCKCTDEPTTFCGRGRGWDRTQCQCVSMCDFIKQCGKGQKWSLRTCQCQPICLNSCPKNFVADPDNKCACTCSLPAEICTPSSFFWDRKSCKCVKKPPCADVTCPTNYSPDPKDKCKCKCNEAPATPCRSRGGARWARNQCRCQYLNDVVRPCADKTQFYSRLTNKCVPKVCNNVCPKNSSPVPDYFCDCHSNLPAEVCKQGFEWNHKTGKCRKSCPPESERGACKPDEGYDEEKCACTKYCSDKSCTGGNQGNPQNDCKCGCIRPRQSCKNGFAWDTKQCQCIVDDYYYYYDYYNYDY